MNNIHFHYDQITILEGQEKYNNWLMRCIEHLGIEHDSITYVFTTDKNLLKLNQEKLNHDYYTDILTFDLRDDKSEPLFADIIISIDRVIEHSKKYGISFEEELKRVMIHGILHLIGFNDHSEEDSKKMREMESKLILL